MKKGKVRNCIIFVSFLLIIGGFIANPHREIRPTIYWLPQFVYVEHLLGVFAIGIILFTILGFLWNLVSLIGYLFSEDFSKIILELKMKYGHNVNFGLASAATLFLSLYYEIWFQKGNTLSQLPFDLIGFAGYLIYMFKFYKS